MPTRRRFGFGRLPALVVVLLAVREPILASICSRARHGL
jgi:hypothetical protein